MILNPNEVIGVFHASKKTFAEQKGTGISAPNSSYFSLFLWLFFSD
jgi:hypothetical protein